MTKSIFLIIFLFIASMIVSCESEKAFTEVSGKEEVALRWTPLFGSKSVLINEAPTRCFVKGRTKREPR